jgi:hypothetical protein
MSRPSLLCCGECAFFAVGIAFRPKFALIFRARNICIGATIE